MTMDSGKGKTFYQGCVKVLNQEKLNDRVDTPWRDHFNMLSEVNLSGPCFKTTTYHEYWGFTVENFAWNSCSKCFCVQCTSALFVLSERQYFTVLYIVQGYFLFLGHFALYCCPLKSFF